jgi:hypothetical protein
MAKDHLPPVRYRNFYLEWLSRAFRGALVGVGFEGGVDIIRGIVLWAIAVLTLYFVDWSGWPLISTINAEPEHEVRFGLCAAAAIVIVFGASFIWHLIVQPIRIHRENWKKIEDNEELIGAIGDTEADRRFLSEAYAEGFRLYRAPVDCSDPKNIDLWKENMDAWVERIRAHLVDRWSVSALHDFDDLGSMGGFTFRRGENDELEKVTADHGFSILCKYSAYLQSADDIIRHGEYKHLGDVQELLLRRDLIKGAKASDEGRGIH